MRTLTLTEISMMGNQEIIPRFEAKVIKVWPQKSGPGQYGTWYLQNVIVQDGEEEMTLTWGGASPWDPSMEGHRFSFECSEGKHGLTGIKRSSKRVDDIVYEGISLTETCKVRILSGNGQEQPSPAHHQWTAPQSGAIGAQPPPKPLDDGVTLARKYLIRESNLYRLVTDAVFSNLTDHIQTLIGQERMSGEMFDLICGRLYTAASKAGLGKGMPEKPL